MQTFRLTSKAVMMNASAMLHNLPVDGSYEAVFRPYVRKRRDEQSSLMWVRLKEISEQAWICGKQYEPEILHEFLKAKYLPEVATEGETLDGYKKYAILPDGNRAVIGSTTKLTTKGFSNYLTQVEAFGASLGVMFSAQNDI